jgi:hypothetical protein
MVENYEEGSIESIANARWGEYHGDVQIMNTAEKLWGEAAHNMVTRALQANFVEGFRQGVLLRLTGETNAQG